MTLLACSPLHSLCTSHLLFPPPSSTSLPSPEPKGEEPNHPSSQSHPDIRFKSCHSPSFSAPAFTSSSFCLLLLAIHLIPFLTFLLLFVLHRSYLFFLIRPLLYMPSLCSPSSSSFTARQTRPWRRLSSFLSPSTSSSLSFCFLLPFHLCPTSSASPLSSPSALHPFLLPAIFPTFPPLYSPPPPPLPPPSRKPLSPQSKAVLQSHILTPPRTIFLTGKSS